MSGSVSRRRSSAVADQLLMERSQRRKGSLAPATTINSFDRAEANWKHIAAKTKAIGFFTRHVSDKAKQRDALSSFMDRMKAQKVADKKELETSRREYEDAENANNRTVIQTIRPMTPLEEKGRDTPDGPKWKTFKVAAGSKCAICTRVFPAFHEHEAVPCRVCDDVFHERCLEGCGDLHTADKMNIGLAHTNTGWSCPKCANISLLLTTEEITQMTDEFDRLDLNQDAQVSLEEYVAHNRRRKSIVYGRGGLLPSDRALLVNEHARLDQNGDGYIDWWEFVNQESKLHLLRKNKRHLASLLTPKELVCAKAVFRRLDNDGDGKIKQHEARDAYLRWYNHFDASKNAKRDETSADSESLDLHATVAAQCIMDADTNGQGEIHWKDFILDQALYIICCRPNYRIRTN